MTRLRRIATHDRYFFITTNLDRKIAPLSEQERDTVVQVIGSCRDRGDFWLFGYCVMPNHLHLLMRPKNQDVAAAIREIKRACAARLLQSRAEVGSIWQPKYFDNVIRRVHDFWAKLEYIHQNPVAADIVATPDQWKWSSYSALMNRSSLPIAVDQPDLPQDPNARLW